MSSCDPLLALSVEELLARLDQEEAEAEAEASSAGAGGAASEFQS
eukprot:CAMPEP_0115097160 /NCGR_PEP_ID=MMETSP0227-20121206/30259_1 /TAXON_ID=89957 /ORGANISM="Polarella glacialis, Strain CCMP 1383" /LENGTH=44 /DNA_ID= /DNA_START= /DNA_END= /DNA_ORIENTATION=